jgi:hypothetical protein
LQYNGGATFLLSCDQPWHIVSRAKAGIQTWRHLSLSGADGLLRRVQVLDVREHIPIRSTQGAVKGAVKGLHLRSHLSLMFRLPGSPRSIETSCLFWGFRDTPRTISFVLLVICQPQAVHPIEPVAALLDFAPKAIRYRALCFQAARGNTSHAGTMVSEDVLLHLQPAVPRMFCACARHVRFQHRRAVNPKVINPNRGGQVLQQVAHQREHPTECLAPEPSGTKWLRMTTLATPATVTHSTIT